MHHTHSSAILNILHSQTILSQLESASIHTVLYHRNGLRLPLSLLRRTHSDITIQSTLSMARIHPPAILQQTLVYPSVCHLAASVLLRLHVVLV